MQRGTQVHQRLLMRFEAMLGPQSQQCSRSPLSKSHETLNGDPQEHTLKVGPSQPLCNSRPSNTLTHDLPPSLTSGVQICRVRLEMEPPKYAKQWPLGFVKRFWAIILRAFGGHVVANFAHKALHEGHELPFLQHGIPSRRLVTQIFQTSFSEDM